MLEELHTKSVKHVFRSGQAGEEAFKQRQVRQQGKRRAKAPAKARCTCPGCDRGFPV